MSPFRGIATLGWLTFAGPLTGCPLIEVGPGPRRRKRGWRYGLYVCSPSGYCADRAFVLVGFTRSTWPPTDQVYDPETRTWRLP